MTNELDYYLDITQDLCPLTFVKIKLLIECMRPGQICEVRLQGVKVMADISRSIIESGHKVMPIAAKPGESENEIHRVYVIKAT